MAADITLINLNMLYVRYGETVDRERHVPLGCLYLTRALEEAGYTVDFRDYQCHESGDPFDLKTFLGFARDPAPVIGLSCMANLLPFTVLASRTLKERYPDRTIVLGGVGATAVEEPILQRFPWIDVIVRGEGELTTPALLKALTGGDLAAVTGISYRVNGSVYHTPARARIQDLDTISLPAFDKVDLHQYKGYGMMTSRGCPYPCTFCSVAPIWNHESHNRSAENIVEEMRILNREAGVDLFLFQDEYFVSGKRQVMAFCETLARSGLDVRWKAFGRVNLTDEEMLHAMADSGCLELRFGIESGSDEVLARIQKGFTAEQVLDIVPRAIEIMPRVDLFYMWGFPFETMSDFNQTLFQMLSFQAMGARILPSLLSLLPQTEYYTQLPPGTELEYCPYLFADFVLTGHEVLHGSLVELPERHRAYFQLIENNPDIFPGFFHVDVEHNVLPKLDLLCEFGFYQFPDEDGTESCGAHSPRVSAQGAAQGAPQDLATRG